MAIDDLVGWFNREQQRQYGQQLDVGYPLRTSGHEVTGVYAGITLRSVFQAIFDTETGRLIGYEGLLRALTAQGSELSPAAVFSLPSSASEMVYLDRLCRILLQEGEKQGLLALNVHPRHVAAVSTGHGRTFEAVLHQCGLSPENVVLEISSRALHQPQHLIEAVHNYRQRGYRVALDNVRQIPEPDHLTALRPDWIKFDPVVRELPPAKLRLLLASALAGQNHNPELLVIGSDRTQSRSLGLALSQAETLSVPQRKLALHPPTTIIREHRHHVSP